MKTIDATPLTQALDALQYRTIADIDNEVVTGLEILIGRGATEDDIKAILGGYVEDNFTRRLLPAARHLRRQRMEAGQ
jgi:hypothetical protein